MVKFLYLDFYDIRCRYIHWEFLFVYKRFKNGENLTQFLHMAIFMISIGIITGPQICTRLYKMYKRKSS